MNKQWLQAVEEGDTVAVIKLLDQGADVDAALDRTRTTALFRAIRNGHVEMMKILIAHGASLTAENSIGFSPITYALIRSRNWGDYWKNPRPDPRPLQLLLEAGGRFGLLEAVFLNDVDLARVCLDGGADPDIGQWKYHGPLLKIAAEFGYLDIVNLLLDRGANIEATDDIGQRPLMCAARYNRTEVVRRLLDRGAEINAVGWTEECTLSNAAIEGHHEIVELLLSRGAEWGFVDTLALNDVELFETLLDIRLPVGSDVDSFSDERSRLAILAAARGNVAIVRLLLDRGAAHTTRDLYGNCTLLVEAAMNGHVEVAQLLIDRGADLHAVGTAGLTPLAWAVKEGHDDVATMLKLAGAVK